MSYIHLKNICKTYRQSSKVLDNVSFSSKPGEFVVIVGPSGCGKTTLLRIIAGLEDVSGGEVWINGRDVTNLPPSKRELSMVFQSYALYPHMTVYQNIAFAIEKVSREEVDKRVLRACKLLQLDHLLERTPKELSGGQRQRVAIGRCLVRNPKLFLFDEPLSNLDTTLRTQMRYRLARLKQQLNAGMIYVTHDQVEAMTLADQIVVMRDGSVEQVGAPQDLYNHPQTQFVANFIGSIRMNFLQSFFHACSSTLAKFELMTGEKFSVKGELLEQIKVGSKVLLGVRPEHVSVHVKRQKGRNILCVKGVLRVLENLGSDSLLHIDVDVLSSEKFLARVFGDVEINIGQTVYISFDLSKTHLFDKKTGKILANMDSV